MLESWKGSLTINDEKFENIGLATSRLQTLSDDMCIFLHSASQNASKSEPECKNDVIYKIFVKAYMTRKATPDFDFMAHFNNDNPMPMRIMVGTVERESPKMFYMKLHGDIIQEQTIHCMKCGKRLDNPVSRFFGMGPECGGHNYTHPFDTDEELKAAVESYRLKLQEITWEGWIPKSAITIKEEM